MSFGAFVAEERAQRELGLAQDRAVRKRSAPVEQPHVECPELVAAQFARTVDRVAVSEAARRVWLDSLHCHGRDGETWVVACRVEMVGWVGFRFGRLLATAAGAPVRIVICGGAA